MKKITYSDLLKETVEYYSEDPEGRRGMNGGMCSYKTEDGKMCAVGRCIIHPELFQEAGAGDFDNLLQYIPDYDFEDLAEKDIENLGDDHEGNISKILKPEYKHLTDLQFWSTLQSLHDYCNFWNKKGLTEEGIIEVKKLEKYCKELDEQFIEN